MSAESSSDALLKEILQGLHSLRKENSQLASAVDAINGRVNMLSEIKQIKDEAKGQPQPSFLEKAKEAVVSLSEKAAEAVSTQYEEPPSVADVPPRRASVSKTSKIILTSYPGQSGVDPLPMEWGHKDPAVRGAVVVSRHANTIRRRNGMFVSSVYCSTPNIVKLSVLTVALTQSTTLLP
jgi:hypothetical protein